MIFFMDILPKKYNASKLMIKTRPCSLNFGIWGLSIVFTMIVLSGCTSTPQLIPTPNLYNSSNTYPDSALRQEQKQPQIDMLYVTDRLADPEKKQLEYGSKRSESLGFGSTLVDIGNELSWDQLMDVSESQSNGKSLEMRVGGNIELGRFPPTPHRFTVVDGRPVVDPNITKEYDETADIFRAEIRRRLDLTDSKDVFIYVHGFNNTFNEAVANLAGIWHFMGRQGVPLVYTWPAAHGGLFGYFIDRESGEFTIFHLKNLLKLLASFSEIENIHIIAHSRGTDITTTALRELIIENRGADKNPRESLRINNLILAAPDLDFGVMRQRLIAEKFGVAFGQITVYTAKNDNALNVSEFIMSGLRLGHLKSKDFSDTEKEIFSSVKNVHFINVVDVRSFVSHAYYLESPSASSDLIRVLLNSSKPGSVDRPLTHKQYNFWEIPPEYPNASPVQ